MLLVPAYPPASLHKLPVLKACSSPLLRLNQPLGGVFRSEDFRIPPWPREESRRVLQALHAPNFSCFPFSPPAEHTTTLKGKAISRSESRNRLRSTCRYFSETRFRYTFLRPHS